MTSFHYSHNEYAGNYGDVIKHVILAELLRYYVSNNDHFYYIDSHAGFGQYLVSPETHPKARKGFYQLLQSQTLDPLIQNYLTLVDDLSKPLASHGNSHLYPGSPLIAKQYLRVTDRLELFELFPEPYTALKQHFSDSHIGIYQQNGFNECVQFQNQQGILFIDPPYTQTSDYEKLQTTVTQLSNSSLTVVIWYPITENNASKIDSLVTSVRNGEVYKLKISDLKGAGVLIQNGPAALKNAFNQTVEVLNQVLVQN